MDNISKILEAIHEDGKLEADKIIAASRKNSDDVLKLYREEAETRKQDILKKAQKEADEITQRGISQAGIESRNRKLTVRREALEQAFSLAHEQLVQLSAEDKLELYTKLVGKYSDTKEVTVILNDQDTKTLGDKLTKQIKAQYDIKAVPAKAQGNFSGGLILEAGSVEINCTFEVLINDMKKQMESEIAAVLFA